MSSKESYMKAYYDWKEEVAKRERELEEARIKFPDERQTIKWHQERVWDAERQMRLNYELATT